MRVTVNGVRLYFDIKGSGLAARDREMVAKPTLVLLHGGPGADHSLLVLARFRRGECGHLEVTADDLAKVKLPGACPGRRGRPRESGRRHPARNLVGHAGTHPKAKRRDGSRQAIPAIGYGGFAEPASASLRDGPGARPSSRR
jgi:hypothetical protein